MSTRRDFLKKSALLSLGGVAGRVLSEESITNIERLSSEQFVSPQFSLPPLPYAYDALEPFIDKQTMELHHDKHHQAYVDKLNTALQDTKSPGDDTIEKICKNIHSYSEAVRNNGGGHYNHSLFWSLMKENKAGKTNEPSGNLHILIKSHFNSFEEFKNQFGEAAMKRFGSGWTWLVKEKGKSSLKISSTPNQDNPLMPLSEVTGTPILALDVWEHAYYLKYLNKRADYINAWWNLVNWDKANELLMKSAD